MQDERYPERTMRRFWEKIANEPKPDVCWLWGASLMGLGYAQFWDPYEYKPCLGHVFAYKAFVGPIPDGLHLDHLCRVRHCVNPAHLEPVTHAENVLRGEGISAVNARKTHCKHGHPLSGENLYLRPDGGRQCRECRRQASLRYLGRRSAA
jgi:hypothetical protein